jgi:hypothetical protein
MGNKGYIGTNGQPISTEQDKISGVKGSTGNKGFNGDKGPFISREQGKISDVKGSSGNKVLLVAKDRSSIQSKVTSQMTKFSGK